MRLAELWITAVLDLQNRPDIVARVSRRQDLDDWLARSPLVEIVFDDEWLYGVLGAARIVRTLESVTSCPSRTDLAGSDGDHDRVKRGQRGVEAQMSWRHYVAVCGAA